MEYNDVIVQETEFRIETNCSTITVETFFHWINHYDKICETKWVKFNWMSVVFIIHNIATISKQCICHQYCPLFGVKKSIY